MRTVPLGDVCHVTTGQSAPQESTAFGSSGTPFVRAGSLERLCAGGSEESLELVPSDQAVKFRLKKFPKDTIVFAKSGMSAKLGRVYRLRRECHVVSHLAAVLPSADVDPAYLLRWFEYNPPSRLIENDAYPSIKTSELEKIPVQLPAIAEQHRIAAILDKTDVLRGKRRAAIAKLDQLLQSIFLDMFGDPVSNPKSWPRVPFSEFLERIESGNSPVCLDRPKNENEWGVLKLGAVTRCRFDPSANKALPNEASFDERLEVKLGDLLFTRKNTYELVAACAYVHRTPERLLLPDLIFRLRLKEPALAHPRYLQSLLTYPRKRSEVQSLAGGSAGSMPNISKAKLNNALIELPPFSLQEKFSRLVEHIEQHRHALQRHATQLDTLFASLQHRAFAGDL